MEIRSLSLQIFLADVGVIGLRTSGVNKKKKWNSCLTFHNKVTPNDQRQLSTYRVTFCMKQDHMERMLSPLQFEKTAHRQLTQPHTLQRMCRTIQQNFFAVHPPHTERSRE